jgi:hypothetical protein
VCRLARDGPDGAALRGAAEAEAEAERAEFREVRTAGPAARAAGSPAPLPLQPAPAPTCADARTRTTPHARTRTHAPHAVRVAVRRAPPGPSVGSRARALPPRALPPRALPMLADHAVARTLACPVRAAARCDALRAGLGAAGPRGGRLCAQRARRCRNLGMAMPPCRARLPPHPQQEPAAFASKRSIRYLTITFLYRTAGRPHRLTGQSSRAYSTHLGRELSAQTSAIASSADGAAPLHVASGSYFFCLESDDACTTWSGVCKLGGLHIFATKAEMPFSSKQARSLDIWCVLS